MNAGKPNRFVSGGDPNGICVAFHNLNMHEISFAQNFKNASSKTYANPPMFRLAAKPDPYAKPRHSHTVTRPDSFTRCLN